MAATPAAGMTMLIRPGVGIGKVRLGMTEAQVRKALGRPSYVVKRERRGFGSQYLEVGWDLAAWTVGLQGRAGRLRVVKVATTLPSQRARKVGPGSTIRQVMQSFPSARCVDKQLPHTAPNTITRPTVLARWLVLRAPTGRETVFVVRYRFDAMNGAAIPPPGHVVEVAVQERLPGGGVTSSACPAGWRHDAPAARPS